MDSSLALGPERYILAMCQQGDLASEYFGGFHRIILCRSRPIAEHTEALYAKTGLIFPAILSMILSGNKFSYI